MNEKVKTVILAGGKFLPGTSTKICAGMPQKNGSQSRRPSLGLYHECGSIREAADFLNSPGSAIRCPLINAVRGDLSAGYEMLPLCANWITRTIL